MCPVSSQLRILDVSHIIQKCCYSASLEFTNVHAHEEDFGRAP